MSAFITYLLFLPLFFSQASQTYYVVHVKGNITNKVSKRAIQVGDRLQANDQLMFKSEQDLAVVYDTQKGRYVLNRPREIAASAQNEFIAIVKNLVIDDVSTAALSTRNFVKYKTEIDLKQLFAENTFVLLGSRTKIMLDSAIYPMSAKTFFVYRYSYQGNQVNKRIPFATDTLIFDVNKLYTINGKWVMPEEAGETDLLYYNTAENTSKYIASFRPVYVSDQVLKKELQTLADVLKTAKTSTDEIRQHLHLHMQSLYGYTDKNILDQWVTEHIQ